MFCSTYRYFIQKEYCPYTLKIKMALFSIHVTFEEKNMHVLTIKEMRQILSSSVKNYEQLKGMALLLLSLSL